MRRWSIVWILAAVSVSVGGIGARAGDDGALRLAGERFFREHAKPVEFRRSGNRLWLANRAVGIEFVEDAKGCGLSRLYGIATGIDYLAVAPGNEAQPLWLLSFRKDKGRDPKEFHLSSLATATISSRVEPTKHATTLHLVWSGLNIEAERGCVDVAVSVTVVDGDPLSRWRIAVENRSRTFGLWNVNFPRIELAPIGEPEKNRFALAHSGGCLSNDPFRKPIKTLYDWQNKYPEWINMQFQALYHEDGRGLYLATHDGTGHRKLYHCDSIPARCTLEYSIDAPPPNMGFPGERFALPYDVCLGPFQGDWYDACQIYRRWAINQVWCSRGNLRVRRDIPTWFKENPYMLTLYSNEKGGEAIPCYQDQILALEKYLEIGLPVNWYCWKKYLPEQTGYNSEHSDFKVPTKASTPCGNEHDGNYPALPAWHQFAPACEAIARSGGHVNAYVCSSLYDPGLRNNAPFATKALASVCRDAEGKPIWGEGVDVSYRMCPHSDWWGERMRETIVALIRNEHVRGVYFDTFFGGAFQCWDTRHGHVAGGGNASYLGDRKLAAVVRPAMKAADPQATMVGESCCETAIDLLDGVLTWHTLQPGEVPMWSTVYGDYIPRQGMWLAPAAEGFYAQAATLFTERTQLGRIALAPGVNYLDRKYAEPMAFLKKLGDCWRSKAGMKYLAYGRLLRPLDFLTPRPVPIFHYHEPADEIGPIDVPALYSCVLESADGSLGVFVINITEKPLAIRFELKPGRYPISALTAYRAARIDAKGSCIEASVHKGAVSYTGTIPGRDLIFLDIAAVR